MRTRFLHLLSYLACTTASTVVINATYDDLPDALISPPIGTYDGLVYTAWSLGTSNGSVISVGGLDFASPPNRAVTNAQQQLADGTASFVVAPPYKSFGVLDFFFGCTIRADESEVGVALASQCTITVAGFVSSNDQEAAVASFTFTPPETPLTPVPMIHAVLPTSFQQPIVNVTIAQDNPLISVLIDNLHYSAST